MNRSLLKQLLTYINKVYHIGEKINTLIDKRVTSSFNISTITFVTLFGFMLQIRSFNRLKNWINTNKFKKIVPKKSKIPHIDSIRRCLSDFDLDGLKEIHKSIIRTTIKNKIFQNGTMYGFKVVAIDGVELFESTKKSCSDCLTRKDKNGTIHYFHRSVVCASIGSDPHIVLGQEMLQGQRDSGNKDEGEITGGKRLIKNLYKDYHHFADIIVADALYCKSTWIKEVQSIGIDVVIRVKDERLNIVKDALALFRSQNEDKEWTIRKSEDKYTKIKAWDVDHIEMPDSSIDVRFIKFKEEIYSKNKDNTVKVECREVMIITTHKFIDVEILWQIIHKRWDIENNIFHVLKTEWNMDHCFMHSSNSSVETILILMLIAFNLMQLFFFRAIKNFRKKRMLQVDIIENIRDERFQIEDDWHNPIFEGI